ncbi:MAG: hypothetical protein P8Y10_09460 [Gemmatimonadales bacterium]|jgi:hypothetical protein
MITPKYTGFYKPALTLKAATLSLRATEQSTGRPPRTQGRSQKRTLLAVERVIKRDKTAKAA